MEWQPAANWATSILSVMTLGGLAVRRRARRSYAFTVYLIVTAVQGVRLALASAPDSWRAWVPVQLLLRALCVAVALEIAVRLFGTLAAAARGARWSILGVISLTSVFLWIELPGPAQPPFLDANLAEVAAFDAARRLLPRLAYGSAWLFAALYAVATTFALPLDPLHRLILMGFGAYLMLYAVTLATLPAVDLDALAVSAVQTLAFLGLLGVWAYAAWRPESPPAAPPAVVRRLWPWL